MADGNNMAPATRRCNVNPERIQETSLSSNRELKRGFVHVSEILEALLLHPDSPASVRAAIAEGTAAKRDHAA